MTSLQSGQYFFSCSTFMTAGFSTTSGMSSMILLLLVSSAFSFDKSLPQMLQLSTVAFSVRSGFSFFGRLPAPFRGFLPLPFPFFFSLRSLPAPLLFHSGRFDDGLFASLFIYSVIFRLDCRHFSFFSDRRRLVAIARIRCFISFVRTKLRSALGSDALSVSDS